MSSETNMRMRIKRGQRDDPTFTTFNAHFGQHVRTLGQTEVSHGQTLELKPSMKEKGRGYNFVASI